MPTLFFFSTKQMSFPSLHFFILSHINSPTFLSLSHFPSSHFFTLQPNGPQLKSSSYLKTLITKLNAIIRFSLRVIGMDRRLNLFDNSHILHSTSDLPS